MNLLAIDPGTTQSAYVFYDTHKTEIHEKDIVENQKMIAVIESSDPDEIAIEMIAAMGMAVGKSVFETCLWIGRYVQVAYDLAIPCSFVYRREEKIFLCGSMKAKDANIRQAIIDILGKEKTKGIHKDMWAALAVALTYADKVKNVEAVQITEGIL